ncbi:HSP20-like chaperone [Microdochium bolleyi]|uniref:HSP20-like chaperone n=1 Tax=Microdochium bolleyi TaxID=196109 RepID=A0A136J0M7_9PEZI|nr:HSP20-like chaperone [Microdochium bolleyi]
MSIFTPAIYNEPSFTGLFRLLDDFDNYRSGSSGSPSNNQQQLSHGSHHHNNNGMLQRGGGGLLGSRFPAFNPKFDLRETDTAFELHGDLPGVDKDQVHVEFADEHTLTVRGRVEREWKSSSGGDDESKKAANHDNDSNKNNKEAAKDAATNKSNNTAAADTNKDNEKQVSKSDSNNSATAASGEPPQKQARYWITERSVGEFSRSFRLGGHEAGAPEIDHDGVRARLDNGVLSVTVPKKVRKETQAKRRIAIN